METNLGLDQEKRKKKKLQDLKKRKSLQRSAHLTFTLAEGKRKGREGVEEDK